MLSGGDDIERCLPEERLLIGENMYIYKDIILFWLFEIVSIQIPYLKRIETPKLIVLP